MKGIKKSVVYRHLKKCHDDIGGYTGTDIVKLAQQLNVDRTTLSRSIEKWSEKDIRFSDIKYLGKRYIQITLDEILKIEHSLEDNPMMVKKYLLESTNANRIHNDMLPLLKTTFYEFVDKYFNSILNVDNIQYIWLKIKGVTPSKKYSIEEAKNSLNMIFNFDGLKGYGGVDLENIATRLQQAKEWFNEYYGGVDPFNFYEKIKGRVKCLQRHLTSIKADESQLIQVRLIFEIQVAFIVNCQDFLIEQIIHRRIQILQSMNKVRQKTENRLRGNRIDGILKKISNLVNWSNEVDKTVLKEIVNEGHPESALARIKILKSHKESYKVLLATLKKITNDLSEQEITPHTDAASLFLEFARNKKLWMHINERDRNTLIKDQIIAKTISKGDQDLLDILVTDRIIKYIKNGKITFIRSYKFQDISSLIKSVSLKDSERNIDQKTLTQLQTGNFPIDVEPLTKMAINKTEINEEDDLEEGVFSNKIPFKDVVTHVSRLVKEHNPERFDEQIKIFKEETDNMFSMEYNEYEFYQHFYNAIGFLGRNLRYTDSNEFQNNRYCIQRYVNDRSLDLELSFMWKTLRDILGYSESAIIIDTMGIDSRRKSIFADYHGRYHTIGFADLRAISLLMFPVFSTNCKSTDSEAMNIMEILNHANLVLSGNLKIYT
ncbi:hypothetical protein MSIBF_A1910030 [groundwater metagenome]|uniref:Uncharacterized protein n=1 Tax=groundwater metagenome TaxID=717931 RepID=A0A098E996_9ZZZZ